MPCVQQTGLKPYTEPYHQGPPLHPAPHRPSHHRQPRNNEDRKEPAAQADGLSNGITDNQSQGPVRRGTAVAILAQKIVLTNGLILA
jgi:hypothetical protein